MNLSHSLLRGTITTTEDYLGANEVFQNGATNDGLYITADNGVDTLIFLITVGADDTYKQFKAADYTGTAIMKILGLADASDLAANNLSNLIIIFSKPLKLKELFYKKLFTYLSTMVNCYISLVISADHIQT